MRPQTFSPGPTPNTVRTHAGQTVPVPAGWVLLPPGDAALTRRVKAAGECWLVQEKVGRRTFSRGIWAASGTIEQIREDLAAERSTAAHAKRRAADARRREARQAEYVEDFEAAVVAFLAFHERHAELAVRLARAVAAHATPVGSGTVARTTRIPIERRAESALIAWMRHQTTAYDSMKIARVKGQRREVRRLLARRSKELLAGYRSGDVDPAACPLAKALRSSPLAVPAAAIPLPPYSYVPGHGLPHPVNDPAGHLYADRDSAHEPPIPAAAIAELPADAASRHSGLAALLATNVQWLHALGLFNGGFYWEAHEAWEGFWLALGRTSPEAKFVQGLIHLAAAAVKIREGKPAGVKSHAKRGRELLGELASREQDDPGPGPADALGLARDSIAAVLGELEAHKPECWHTSRFPVVKVLAGGLRIAGPTPGQPSS